MQKRESNNLKIYLLFAISSLTLVACYENKVACLDPDAANYDVTTDENCEDCCIYPTLSLLISQRFGDGSFNRTDTIFNNVGAMFVIEDVQTYLSHLVVNSNTQSYRISDQLTITNNDNIQEELIDDIILVKPNTFRYNIGTFKEADEYKSITFNLGAPPKVDQANAITVPAGHPLLVAGDSLYVEDIHQFVKSRIVLRQVGYHDKAVVYKITPEYSFEIKVEGTQLRGNNIDLNLTADYLELISQIDYFSMNETQVKIQLEENYKKLFKPK